MLATQTTSGREYSSLCASLGATPIFCADGVDIQDLLTRAMERDAESALDHETDDEQTDFGNDNDCRSNPEPCAAGGGPESSTVPSNQHASSSTHACALGSGQKRGRSASPTPLPKKSKNARKHKKARYARAEQREREGHVPRPKVIQRNVQSGTGIKTALDSEKLPAAHGAYVAKNGSERSAGKQYSPAELDAMGFTGIAWNGM